MTGKRKKDKLKQDKHQKHQKQAHEKKLKDEELGKIHGGTGIGNQDSEIYYPWSNQNE